MEQPPSPQDNLGEHAKYFDAHPEAVTRDYLNNFESKMSGGKMRPFFESYPAVMDKPFSSGTALHSEMRKRQTMRQFFATMDEEVARVGTDPVALYRALRARGYTHYDLVQ